MLLCLWDDAYNPKVAPVAAVGFLSDFLSGPYVSCHITVNKMC